MAKLSTTARIHTQVKLAASEQMQLAIKLLEANRLKLRQMIEVAICENPLLELQMEALSDGCAENQNTSGKREELDFNEEHFEWIEDIDEDFHHHFEETYSPLEIRSEHTWEENKVDILQFQPHHPHLQEFLEKQLFELCDDPALRKEALWLASYTNEKGLLECPLKELASENKKSIKQLKKAQTLLQEIEPKGFGSETLQEALLIQLSAKNLNACLCYQIIKDHWSDLLHRQWQLLSHKLHTTPQLIEHELRHHIQSLHINVNPEEDHSIEDTASIDLVLEFDRGIMNVKLLDNPNSWIKLQSNYLEGSAFAGDKESQLYIKQKKAESLWLLKALAQREHHLLLVTKTIADWQKEYLTSQGPLKPMILKDIAQLCNIHESTVARACQDKLVQTPIGVISLKSLFCSSLKCSEKPELSSEAICEKIKLWIEQENPHQPLSDEEIAQKLKETQMPCARRTVAKYRMRMGFSPSHLRKMP